jgi:hypothetical protein
MPPITCLCPTYGRFDRLRDAVACFLLQDYEGYRKLLILNDAALPIRLCEAGGIDYGGEGMAQVQVLNNRARFMTLGHKRQALLEAAGTPLVAHWDDDDLYLPWHLQMCVAALQAQSWASCAKPGAAWFATGPRAAPQVHGIRHNVFEGQMVFRQEEALALGGYPPKVSGQAAALLAAFKRAGKLYTWNPAPEDTSYVYRWADGLAHVSGKGDTEDSHRLFGAQNQDFGARQPLIPAGDPIAWARERLTGQFRRLGEGMASDAISSTALRRGPSTVVGAMSLPNSSGRTLTSSLWLGSASKVLEP